MLQTFTLTGTGRQIDAAARFFRYESGSAAGADEAIRVYADGNDLGTYLPGDAVRLPVNATRWVLTPVSAALVATVRLGIGEVESARLVGNVRVVDQAADKTRAGAQFIGSIRLAGQGAACSVVGIQAATRTLVVKGITVLAATTEVVFMATGTAAPGTIVTSSNVPNKLIGGAPSNALLFTTTFAASTPTGAEAPGYTNIVRNYVTGFVQAAVPLTTPLVLAPGQVLYLNGALINREVAGIFDIEEL